MFELKKKKIKSGKTKERGEEIAFGKWASIWRKMDRLEKLDLPFVAHVRANKAIKGGWIQWSDWALLTNRS